MTGITKGGKVKKVLTVIIASLILIVVFTACEKDAYNSELTGPYGINGIKFDTLPGAVGYQLFAGQHTRVGYVIVENDEDSVYVVYWIDKPGWCLVETHLHVANSLEEIPQTRSGNPKIGRFDYQKEHDCVTEFTYSIPNIWECDNPITKCHDVLYIAAHAVVVYDDGCTYLEETAWGAEGDNCGNPDFPFPGRSWATYFTYDVYCPPGGW